MTAVSAERVSRLLALVPWLAQNDGVSMETAAQHFGVTPEQLEQDLWLVICCGLPGHGPDQLIDIQFWDDDGRIHVIDPQTLQRPLRLTPDEVVALLIGLRILAQVPGEHDREVLATATSKLEDAAVDADSGTDRVVVMDAMDESVREAVDRAMVESLAVRITYAGATKDELTDRVVDPVRAFQRDGHTYLEAWCRRAEAFRTFRGDRIVTAEVLAEPARAPHHDLPGAPAEAGTRALLRFTAQGRWVAHSLGLASVEEFDDGSGQAEVLVADPRWLVRLVLGQGGHVEVLGPPDLRRAVQRAAQDALSALD